MFLIIIPQSGGGGQPRTLARFKSLDRECPAHCSDLAPDPGWPVFWVAKRQRRGSFLSFVRHVVPVRTNTSFSPFTLWPYYFTVSALFTVGARFVVFTSSLSSTLEFSNFPSQMSLMTMVRMFGRMRWRKYRKWRQTRNRRNVNARARLETTHGKHKIRANRHVRNLSSRDVVLVRSVGFNKPTSESWKLYSFVSNPCRIVHSLEETLMCRSLNKSLESTQTFSCYSSITAQPKP